MTRSEKKTAQLIQAIRNEFRNEFRAEVDRLYRRIGWENYTALRAMFRSAPRDQWAYSGNDDASKRNCTATYTAAVQIGMIREAIYLAGTVLFSVRNETAERSISFHELDALRNSVEILNAGAAAGRSFARTLLEALREWHANHSQMANDLLTGRAGGWRIHPTKETIERAQE